MSNTNLVLGDCIEAMRALPEASVGAIVTDPPYELGFMGKGWDRTGIANSVEMWSEALRVLKPGGHLAAFGGTRTYHRMACAIEDAGFEIRDCLAWLYGSGFPKSLDVSKAIDARNGDERPVVGEWHSPGRGQRAEVQAYGLTNDHGTITSAASAASAAWEGWGTALKPAYEPIVLARKPLIGTVAGNVLAHGTGALNIDGCRIGDVDTRRMKRGGPNAFPHEDDAWTPRAVEAGSAAGRWPANVVLDEEAAAILDVDASGPVSRFFYTAKASRSEREAGVEVEPQRRIDSESRADDAPGSNNPRLRVSERRNDHPTVKPVKLMRWLVTLLTPPGGTVLDPFMGSGTTGIAAVELGFGFIGIEKEERYYRISGDRIRFATK